MENLNGHVPILRAITRISQPMHLETQARTTALDRIRNDAFTMVGRRHQRLGTTILMLDDWEGVRTDLSSYFAEKVRSTVHADAVRFRRPAGIPIPHARGLRSGGRGEQAGALTIVPDPATSRYRPRAAGRITGSPPQSGPGRRRGGHGCGAGGRRLGRTVVARVAPESCEFGRNQCQCRRATSSFWLAAGCHRSR